MNNRRTPSTDEHREKQMVSMAMDLAARQLEDGTASSQVITHFLKAGSERERLERQRLETENEVLKAKVEAMQSARKVEELYAEALEAMRLYAGRPRDNYDDEYYE